MFRMLMQHTAWNAPIRTRTSLGIDTCTRSRRLALFAVESDEEEGVLEPLDADVDANVRLIHSNGMEIDAYMEAFVRIKGKRYLLAVPRDEPALLATPSETAEADDDVEADVDEMEVLDVEDEEVPSLIEEASKALTKVLKPINPDEPVTLVRSAFTFTIKNAEFDPVGDFDEEEDEEDDYDEDEDEEYEVDLITVFTKPEDGEEREYYVYRIVEPVIMVADDSPIDGQNYNLIPDEDRYEIMTEVYDILEASEEYNFEEYDEK